MGDKVSKKLEHLGECLHDGSYEDAAGHLCDLLELCRHKIVTENDMMFASMAGMVKKYGADPDDLTERGFL